MLVILNVSTPARDLSVNFDSISSTLLKHHLPWNFSAGTAGGGGGGGILSTGGGGGGGGGGAP